MSVSASKIRADLYLRRGRNLLVMVAIFVGTTMFTASYLSRWILTEEIPASFSRTLPPTAVVAVPNRADIAFALVRAEPQVDAATLRRQLRGRIRASDGTYVSLLLTVLPELEGSGVSSITILSRVNLDITPAVFIERSSLPVLGQSNDRLSMRLPGSIELAAVTAGIVADGAVAPGVQDRIVYAYATPTMLPQLNNAANFDEVVLRVDPSVTNPSDVVEAIIGRLRQGGIEPSRVERAVARHPHADQMEAVLLLLTVFAGIGGLVACSITLNVVTAALRAEQQLIGVMKAMGASTVRLVALTASTLFLVALPASVLGVLVGVSVSRTFVEFVSIELNLVTPDLSVRWQPIVVSMGVGLLIPLLVACLAAYRAVTIPILDAIRPQRAVVGISSKSANLGRLSKSILFSYAIRNQLRHPIRLAITAGALMVGGVAIMSAANVYTSLVSAVDRAFTSRSDDLDIRLVSPMDREGLLALSRKVDGVQEVEAWGGLLVAAAAERGAQSGARFGLLAPPRNTKLLKVPIAEGQWLSGDEAREVVASRNLMAREPQMRLGDSVTLAFGTRRANARLVGVVEEATEPGLYTTGAIYDELVGRSGTAGALRIVASGNLSQVGSSLDEALFSAGGIPALLFDKHELRNATTAHFVILLVLLGSIASAALLVASLGLSSSVSIALVERAREVGIVRAIGATDRMVFQLFLLESLAAASVAVILAVLAAFPVSWLISMMLGEQALHIDIPLVWSGTGLSLCIGSAVVITVIATSLPVWRNLSEPVRNALAFE